MGNLSSEDKTDTLPKRPTRIQPYQFKPVRQDFERVPEHRVSFQALTEVLATQMGVMRRSKKAHLNCINLIHFCLTAGQLRGHSCIIVIPGVIRKLLQFAATQ